MTGTAERIGAQPPGDWRASRAHTALSRFGEDAAARWLAERGYVIADRNWRGEAGESWTSWPSTPAGGWASR